MFAPSGEQVLLVHGESSAVVTEVGATLRSFRVDSSPVIWEFGVTELDSGSRGQVLAPWPNRLEDGCYRFGSVVGQAPLDEPGRHNAIHGLVRWMAWTIEDRSADRVNLSCVIHPQPAYPFRVRLEVGYELKDGEIEVSCSAMNTGPDVAPFGVGFHPYLLGGSGGIDEARVQLLATRRLVLDGRGLPVGEEAVAGSSFELDGRRLGSLALDDCYTGLSIDPVGRWHALVDLGQTRAEIWAQAEFAYAMCYTGDTLEHPLERRRSIAIEPMTCPPNAFRTGEALIEIAPGERWQASWGIVATRSETA